MACTITSTGSCPIEALAIGSVVDTLAGRIDPKLSTHRFLATDYSFGFEAASPKNLVSIGEAVLVNGTCYATSTEEESIEHRKVIWGSEFVTGGMFLLPQQALPTHQLILTEPTPLEHLYQKIYQSVQRPVAFVGIWESEALYTATIEKPPIHGLPVFENREYYFPTQHQTLYGQHCFAIGLLASYKDGQWNDLNKQLEVALYKNPCDGEFSLSSHTHCLTLQSETSLENITPKVVDRCLHVFTDKTIVKKGHLNLYTLDQVHRWK